MNDKTPQQESDDSIIALGYGLAVALGFVIGLATMWLISRIWS
jgi:hypothetical protein